MSDEFYRMKRLPPYVIAEVNAMRAFIAEATRLAAARQRALTGRDDRALSDEREHLARATRLRQALLRP